jgi:hypothetical protein
MAKGTAQKEKTFTVAVSVLGIDSNFEPATLAAFQYREKNVYPYIASKDFCRRLACSRAWMGRRVTASAATPM